MPADTGELTVYGCEALEAVLSPAVDIFRAEYPDVDVNYVRLSEDEFDVRISTELSAGKGPDLLFCLSRDTPDPYVSLRTWILILKTTPVSASRIISEKS